MPRITPSLHTPRVASAPLLLLLVTSLLMIAACSKQEKPKELLEIEALWQNPETRKIKDIPGAERYYREARQFRYDAQEAYNDGEQELAQEYAIWSKLRYKTALAISKQYDGKERLDIANARVAEFNPKITAVNQERNKLVAEVGRLEREVAVAQRQRDAQARRNQAGVDANVATQSQLQNDAQKRQAVLDKMRQIQAVRQNALNVNAEKNAAASFNRAENQYNSLKTMQNASPVPYNTFMSTADQAIRGFEQAAQESQTGYKVDVAKQDPAARQDSLLKAARQVLSPQYATSEGNAVRAIVPGSFARGATSTNATGQSAITELAKLAMDYDEFSLRIEAFTSRGDPTENLGVSQLRARAVEDGLVAKGVPKARISIKGQGQDQLRFAPSDTMNDRFELVFRRP